MENNNELNTHDLLKKCENIKVKHDNLKKEILDKTLETEKLIEELYKIEKQYTDIVNQLKMKTNVINE